MPDNPLDFTFVSPAAPEGAKLLVSPISDDETMWLARIDFDDLQNLFDNPVKWVDQLNDQLPDERKAERPIQVEPHFLISYKGPEPAPPGEKSHLLVEGIIKTGLLTIRPKMSTPGHNFAGLAAFALNSPTGMPNVDIETLQDIHLKNMPNVEVTVSGEFGLGFAHYQVTTRDDPFRAEKITAHLVALSHQGGFGKLMNTWQVTTKRSPGMASLAADFAPRLDPTAMTSNTHFIYEGSTTGAEMVCSKVVGPIDGTGGMSPETVVVMDYSPPTDPGTGTGGH